MRAWLAPLALAALAAAPAAAAFSKGDPIVVYRRLYIGAGLVLIECDALALR